MTGVADLIREAQTNPARPVIEGLVHEYEIAGLHGPPEVFKTMFCTQLAEALALGVPLLGLWPVPQARRVFLLETEMTVQALGTRLARSFAGRPIPSGIAFASTEQLRRFRRAANLAAKFDLLSGWVQEAGTEVVILDTCNPLFRGNQSPNDETCVGEFFDRLEALPAVAKIFVRHNRKPRQDDGGDSAALIRGSGQFADVPDLLLELRRADKRTQKAVLAVSKFRHGSKPHDVGLWFDAKGFRLTCLPPVVHALLGGPLSRPDLLWSLENQFSIGQRLADAMISELRPYLVGRMAGHQKVFEIDRDAAASAPWWPAASGGHGW